MIQAHFYKCIYPWVFMVMVSLSGCKGQTQKGFSQENEPKVHQTDHTVPDTDPHFIESQAIHTSYGPTSITRNMIQDSKGDFWFASWEGVIHYDGKSFTNFTNKEGLRRFHVFSVVEDKEGNIWFGTIGAGVYRYDGHAFENFTTQEGLVHDKVCSILADTQGNIWFGTVGGLSVYDGESFRNFTTDDGLSHNDVNAILEDKNGRFWFGTRGDACYYDGKTFTVCAQPYGSTFKNVRSVIEDTQGNIWLGGNDGLWYYDGLTYTQVAADFIGNIFEDSNGFIWVSKSEPDDIYRMSLYRYNLLPLPVKGAGSTLIKKEKGQVFGIMEDRQGNIWFGHERGVSRYDGESFYHFSKANE